MYKFLKNNNFYLQFLYRLIIKCVKPNQQKKKTIYTKFENFAYFHVKN